MSVLTLTNVCYSYKNSQVRAVNEVSCTFAPGSLYAVVGPSGSGKSTLLSLLAGLDLPSEGEINLNGDSLAKLNLDRYRQESIAMIFQSFQLFPLLTVMENVCYPMELCGSRPSDARARAAQLLERVGITKNEMARFPSQLSGGQQQRVAIARSLASGAKIILADEPTGNLDAANTENIMGILHRLAHDEGYCVIVVTHDHEVAEAADVVFGMKDGVITQDA